MDFKEYEKSILAIVESKEIKEKITKTITEEQKKYKPLHDYYRKYGKSKPKTLYDAVIQRESFNTACKQVFRNS